MDNKTQIYNFFNKKGLSDIAICGIMGNLHQESGLLSNNLQNTYNNSFELSDNDYTNLVNIGSYTREQFITDNAAYGLGQWKVENRKAELYDFAIANGTTVDDLNMQLNFMWSEMQAEEGLTNELNSCTSVEDATYIFAKNFEGCTANMSERQGYACSFAEEFITENNIKTNTLNIDFSEYGNFGQEIQNFINENKSGNIVLTNGDTLTVMNNANDFNLYINGLRIEPENIESQLTNLYLSELNSEKTDSINLEKTTNDMLCIEDALRKIFSTDQISI